MVVKGILPLVPVTNDNGRPPLHGFDCTPASLYQNFTVPVNPSGIARIFNFSQAGGFIPESSHLQMSLTTQGERAHQNNASANREDRAVIELRCDSLSQEQKIIKDRILKTNHEILNSLSSVPSDVETSAKQLIKTENDFRTINENVFDLVSRTDEVNKLETGNWKTEDNKEISAYLLADVKELEDIASSVVRQESPDLFESVPTEIGSEEINAVLVELGADKIQNLKGSQSLSLATKDVAEVKQSAKAKIQQKSEVELSGLPLLDTKPRSSPSEVVMVDSSILESHSDDNSDFQCSQLPRKKRRGRKMTPPVVEKCQRSTKKMKMPSSYSEVQNHNTCKSEVERQAISVAPSGTTLESENARSMKDSERKDAGDISRKSVRIKQKKSFNSQTHASKAAASRGVDFLDELSMVRSNEL